jgi:hypothetical protein
MIEDPYRIHWPDKTDQYHFSYSFRGQFVGDWAFLCHLIRESYTHRLGKIPGIMEYSGIDTGIIKY